MDKKSKLIVGGLTVIGLAVGIFIGHQQSPDKEQVRVALYKACVNGFGYKPESNNRSGVDCNRRSIDLMMAAVYGGSYIEPPPYPEVRAKYESALDKYKRK